MMIASGGAITKRKREDSKKSKKTELDSSSDNSNKSLQNRFRTPKIPIRSDSGSRRRLVEQKEFAVPEKITKELNDKDKEIKALKDLILKKNDQFSDTVDTLRKENQKLKSDEVSRKSVVNPSIWAKY